MVFVVVGIYWKCEYMSYKEIANFILIERTLYTALLHMMRTYKKKLEMRIFALHFVDDFLLHAGNWDLLKKV